MTHSHLRQAIVIGGSIAGLLAARILCDRFERVILIERDRFPDAPEPRPGVPQATHVHALLTRGKYILEGLFPDLEAELMAMGVPRLNWTTDFRWYVGNTLQPHISSELLTVTCSRPLLEWAIARHLRQLSNFKLLENGKVTGFLTNKEKSKIIGINYQKCGQNTPEYSQPETLTADLVVDASGRNSSTPKWLQELGYYPPAETVINSFLGYASRRYQIPATFTAPWKGLYLQSSPPHQKRGGVLYPVENNQWILTLAGVGRDYPPGDETGFLAFAESLADPILYEAIRHADPLSPIHCFRRTENCRRHYEKLARMPDGLAVLGDAVCAFNPVYGQGMTTAAVGAMTLAECLDHPQGMTGLTRRFQQQLAGKIRDPWLMATGEDGRWETTEGKKPDLMTRFMQGYLDRLLQLTSRHPEMYRTFIEVVHMIEPPAALFHPRYIMWILGDRIGLKPPISKTETSQLLSTK